MRKTHISVGASMSGGLLVLALAPAALGFASSPPSVSLATQKVPGEAGYYRLFPHFVSSLNVTTTIVVPRIKRCTKKYQAIFATVGINFENQGFSAFNDAGMFIECRKGKARYRPWAGNGKEPSLQAHPGDKVVITQVVTPSKLTASVKDETHTHVKDTFVLTGQIEAGPALFGVEATSNAKGTAQAPAPDFGTIQFSASKINGQPLGAQNPLHYQWYNNAKTKLEIKTTKFAANKKSFKTIFVHTKKRSSKTIFDHQRAF